MPRKRRAGKPRPAMHLERFRTLLKFGHDFFNELGDYEPTTEELRQAWRALGPEILQEFAEDRNRAGQRPYAWWRIEQNFAYRTDRDEQLTYLRQHKLLSPEEECVLAERAERTRLQ